MQNPDDQSIPPNSAPQNDVNLNVLGTGCATSFGAGCVGLLLLMAIGAALGVQAVRQGFALPVLGFFIGLLTQTIIGYFTAGAARSHNVAVNLHVLIVGAISMILGLLVWVMPQQNNILSAQTQNVAQLFRLVGWLLTIPVMLLGASWNTNEPR